MVPEVKGIQDHIRAREAKNVMTMMMKIMLMTVRMFKVWMFKIDVRGRRTVSRGQKKAGNQPSLPGTFYFCHSNQCSASPSPSPCFVVILIPINIL